jgi:S1-C subfamily serine protease
MRRGLGLADDDRGVLVSSVASAGVCHGHVKPGDVILAIDSLPVASDGIPVANRGFAAAGRAAAEKATAVVMDAPPWTNGPQDGPSA